MIKLYNETDLSYKTIGRVIDKYISTGKEDTFYSGKLETFSFLYKNKQYDVYIKYNERYVTWRFVHGDNIELL